MRRLTPPHRTSLSFVRLAKQMGIPLWSTKSCSYPGKDRGRTAFSTDGLLEAARASGRLRRRVLRKREGTDARPAIRRHRHHADQFTVAASAEGWTGSSAAVVLSRPSTWRQPAKALELYQTAITEAFARDASLVGTWTAAAAIGASHSGDCRRIAAVVVTGWTTFDLSPSVAPSILAGGRNAAVFRNARTLFRKSALILADALRQARSEAEAAQVFASAISQLEPDDRLRAFAFFIGPT